MTERSTSGPDTTTHVLYATDGGPAAAAAANLLTRCARRDAVEVTVVSAADLEHINSGAASSGPATSVATARRRARELALAGCRDLQAAGLHATKIEVEGGPRTEIMKLADDGDYDVILVGAGNKTWLDRLLHGSVSTYLLHSAAVPVLVVHRATLHPKIRILVADDGSENARGSQSLLMKLADPAACEVTVLGVVTPMTLAAVPDPTTFSTGTGIPTDSVEVAELEHERIAATRERVAEVARSFEDMGFAATAEVDIGHAAPTILMRAEKDDYDLVVMGSRGLGGIRAKLLGSSSNEVSRHASAALVAR